MTATGRAIGVLHPGEMGSAVGAALRAVGHDVAWASAGRSEATRARAAADGLRDVGDLGRLADESDVIVSVCPPGAARDVARQVAHAGFPGTYVDANAVAPATARSIGEILRAAGAVFVDGGIVGPAPRRSGTTRLYLSADAREDADGVSSLFAGSVLEARVVEGDAGAASALKVCYAAWTKGTAALLMAIRALARHEGVDGDLLEEWERSQPDLPARSEITAAVISSRAWRFVDEMEEIASAFEVRGLPGGFHRAAADVYRALARFEHAESVDLDAVVGALGGERG